MTWLEKPVRGLLLDISGVLRDGDTAISGSLSAFQKLRESGLPFRLVTNETQVTVQISVDKLTSLGYQGITVKDIFAPAPAVVKYLREHPNLRPHLLVHPKVLPEFEGLNTIDPNCVVIGDAADYFTYERLNDAFRILIKMKDNQINGEGSQDPFFFTLGRGKYYKEHDGLCLDVGAYTAGLEYSSGVNAETFGKPDPTFFLAAVNDLGLSPEEVVMIGDDIVGDVGGAQGAGLRGVQVRTGKFRQSDENHPKVKPDGIVDNFAEAMQLLLSTRM